MTQKRSAQGWLTKLIYPINCLECGQESDWLCPTCLKALTISNQPKRCNICRKVGENGLCSKCRAETGLDCLVALFSYKQPAVSRLVTNLKYSGSHDITRFLKAGYGRQVTRLLPEQIGDWHFTFIPMTPSHKKERGYNQSQILAETWGEDASIFSALKKSKETPSQVGLTRTERKKNLHRAFELEKKSPEKVIICDDIVTTGSTLREVAKLLRRGGAKEVWGLTLSRD